MSDRGYYASLQLVLLTFLSDIGQNDDHTGRLSFPIQYGYCSGAKVTLLSPHEPLNKRIVVPRFGLSTCSEGLVKEIDDLLEP